MNDIWLAEMKRAMEEKAITEAELAAHLHMGDAEIEQLLRGEMRLSFAQLSALTSYLPMDLQKIMGYEGAMDLVLHDELEIEINEIARGIPAKRRGYFVQAVRYLADLFHTKDEEDAQIDKRKSKQSGQRNKAQSPSKKSALKQESAKQKGTNKKAQTKRTKSKEPIKG